MKRILLGFLSFSLVLLITPVLVFGAECKLYYQDYQQMDWLRWAISSSDYKETDLWAKRPKVRQILKAKGYDLVPTHVLIYDDLMSFLSMEGDNGHAVRVHGDDIIIYRKKQFDLKESVLLFNYRYKSLDKIPSCRGIDHNIAKQKQMRDWYLSAYKEYQTGSMGKAIIYLETIQKTKKGLDVNFPKAIRDYEQFLSQTAKAVGSKESNTNEFKRLEKLREILLTGVLSTYSRSQTSIIDALSGSGANCVANVSLIGSLVKDLNIELPQGFEFGVEEFSDHVQIVVVNKEKNLNWDILTNEADSIFDTPIIKLNSYIRDGLRHSKPLLFSGDKIQISELVNKDYLFLTENLDNKLKIQLDGVNASSETKEELANRIDVFSDKLEYKTKEFSNDPIPLTADNSHLINKGLTSNNNDLKDLFSSLGIDLYKVKVEDIIDKLRGGSARNLSLSDITSDIHDEEAIRIYTESVKRGKYTLEAINKYGYHQFTKYFPKNHPIHDWAYDFAINPLQIFENPDSSNVNNNITFYSGLALKWNVDTKTYKHLLSLPYIERYHYFFNLIIGKAKSFQNYFVPEFTRFLRTDPNLNDLNDLAIKIKDHQMFFRWCSLSFFINYSGNKMTCGDFFEFNVPGLLKSIEAVLLEVEAYKDRKLKNMHKLVYEIDNIEFENSNNIREMLRMDETDFKNNEDYNINVNLHENLDIFKMVLMYILRSPDYFYTAQFSESEKKSNAAFVNFETNEQEIAYEKSENSPFKGLPQVSLPKVSGLPNCFINGKVVNSGICSVSTESSKKHDLAVIKRKVALLKSRTLVILVSNYSYSLGMQDNLFLTLAWRESNTQYVSREFKGKDPKYFFKGLNGSLLKLINEKTVSFTQTELTNIKSRCDKKLNMEEYGECFYQVTLSKFRNLNKNIPAWVNSKEYYPAIYKAFLNDYKGEKWSFLEDQLKIISNSAYPKNYGNIAKDMIFTNMNSDLKNTYENIDEEILKFSSFGIKDFFLSSISYNNYSGFFNERRFYTIASDNLTLYNNTFEVNGQIYISEWLDLRNLNAKEREIFPAPRTYFPSHMDPNYINDELQKQIKEVPLMLKFSESLL